jgi:LPXTG-motif cell wall-anchored protein
LGALGNRVFRFVGVTLIATAGLAIAAVPTAHAATSNSVPLNTTCLADIINNDGTTGNFVPPGLPFPLPTTIARVNGPTEVNAGSALTAIAPSIGVPVPKQVDTKVHDGTIGIEGGGVVNVWAASNIIETITVTGAASMGTPTISGGNVSGATVTKTGPNTFVLKYPGTHTTDPANFRVPPANTDVVPGNEKQFDPTASFAHPNVASFTSPKVTIPLTAGQAGSKIKFSLTKFQADSDVDAFDNLGHIFARAFCDPDKNTLGAVSVVKPPPPGAPDAVADVAQTDQGKAVDVDVLANDTPNAALAIDKDSLAITSNPSNGSAKVNADHTVTYTPTASFAGTDEFTYKLCSVPEPATTTTSTTTTEPVETLSVTHAAVTAPVVHCDTATVTVTVLAPQQIAEAPQSTPTTVAAAAELPKTGSSSTPLALLGLGLVVTGFAATGLVSRSRRRTA